ncbi:MAG TPA: hypothetical protein VNL14_19760 [Candidatus Acidoferrales bacterium]|nr:hypothetical protein [Candidatus Acidoferrales bacterium]
MKIKMVRELLVAGSLVLAGFPAQASATISDSESCSRCCRMRFPLGYAASLSLDGPERAHASLAGTYRDPCDYEPIDCCPYFCDDFPLPQPCNHRRDHERP